jgi:site-specific DNA-methyltransferase (adenine-specific)
VGTRKVRSGTAHRTNGGGNTFGGDNPKPSLPDMSYAGADGTETVTAWDCAPDCAVRLLDEQSGERQSRSGGKSTPSPTFRQANATVARTGHDDFGGASRFFYTAKASRREREAGLEGMPRQTVQTGCGGDMPIDDDGNARDRFKKVAANVHPTVKPLALMRWLCRLVTPPGGVILDPFTGSGSTGCAAVLEGFRFIGIEQEAEYIEIARRRIAHWATQRPQPDTQTELEVA